MQFFLYMIMVAFVFSITFAIAQSLGCTDAVSALIGGGFAILSIAITK